MTKKLLTLLLVLALGATLGACQGGTDTDDTAPTDGGEATESPSP